MYSWAVAQVEEYEIYDDEIYDDDDEEEEEKSKKKDNTKIGGDVRLPGRSFYGMRVRQLLGPTLFLVRFPCMDLATIAERIGF
jgi:hypothetical protein